MPNSKQIYTIPGTGEVKGEEWFLLWYLLIWFLLFFISFVLHVPDHFPQISMQFNTGILHCSRHCTQILQYWHCISHHHFLTIQHDKSSFIYLEPQFSHLYIGTNNSSLSTTICIYSIYSIYNCMYIQCMYVYIHTVCIYSTNN